MPSARQPILYDADCGFCRWSLGIALVWDRRRRLRPVALQDPEAERLLPALTPEQRMASLHLVAADGRVHSGGAALTALLARLPGGAPLAALAAAAPRATDRAYGLVARHRRRLGRTLSDRARARASARIESRR